MTSNQEPRTPRTQTAKALSEMGPVLAGGMTGTVFDEYLCAIEHQAKAEAIREAGLHQFEPYPARGTFAEISMLFCPHCGECRTVTTTEAARLQALHPSPVEPKQPSYIEVRSTACHAGMDGDCSWNECPQLRDGEPAKSRRHCPLDASPVEPK